MLLLLGQQVLWAQAPKTVQLVQLNTPKGVITIYLYDGTPKHKANFLKLVREGTLEGTTFHRVIPNFVAQGGDPNSKDANPLNDGEGGPGYEIDAEINRTFFHKRGAIGAARNGDDQNPLRKSSGSQFYIVLGKVWTSAGLDSQLTRVRETERLTWARGYWERPENKQLVTAFMEVQKQNPDSARKLAVNLNDQAVAAYAKEVKPYTYTPEERTAYTTLGGTPHLDNAYTVFGEVVSGMEDAEALAAVQRDSRDRPLTDLPMQAKVIEMDRKAFELQYKVKIR